MNDGVDWQKLAEQGREMEKMRLLREQTDALNKLSASQSGAPVASTGQYATSYTPQAQVQAAKSKTTAVVLAVFLGFWTWLYTNKVDMAKFWIGLGASVGSALLVPQIYLIVGVGITVWAIVDQARRPHSFYNNYPNV